MNETSCPRHRPPAPCLPRPPELLLGAPPLMIAGAVFACKTPTMPATGWGLVVGSGRCRGGRIVTSLVRNARPPPPPPPPPQILRIVHHPQLSLVRRRLQRRRWWWKQGGWRVTQVFREVKPGVENSRTIAPSGTAAGDLLASSSPLLPSPLLPLLVPMLPLLQLLVQRKGLLASRSEAEQVSSRRLKKLLQLIAARRGRADFNRTPAHRCIQVEAEVEAQGSLPRAGDAGAGSGAGEGSLKAASATFALLRPHGATRCC